MSTNRVLPPLRDPARSLRRTATPRTRAGLRSAAVGAVVVLGLAACGDGEGGGDGSGEGSADLDGVTVEGGFGEPATVEFEPPLELEASASEVLVEGDGEEVESGDTVTIDYTIVSGTDGSELETSFGASTISLPLAEGQTTPDLVDALVGQNLGSRVLVAVQSNPEWVSFAEHVLDDARIATDPRFVDNADRIANVADLEVEIRRTFGAVDPDEIVARLERGRVAWARARMPIEVWEHEQHAARDRFMPVDVPGGRTTMFRPPFNISGVPAPPGGVPALDDHDAGVIADIIARGER